MPCATAQQREADTLAFEYGFRYDPMQFVENSNTLEAALVRRHVFHTPSRGDGAILQARIEEMLADQREDGRLGKPGNEKAGRLIELADLGPTRNGRR